MSPVSIGKGRTAPGVGIEFEWGDVSPEELEYRLAKIEGYLEDTQLLAETLQASLQVDMARKFETETDPKGNHWKELVQPSPFQQGILQLTGEMRDTAISDAPWTATPAGVFFDTTYLPEYWAIHDMGYSARIPRREFIGVSDVEAARAERLGDEWLAGGIMLGGVFRHEVRSPAGTFMALG